MGIGGRGGWAAAGKEDAGSSLLRFSLNSPSILSPVFAWIAAASSLQRRALFGGNAV